MNPLAGFSDWALALLPRLFLYPGGLAIVAALFLAVVTTRPAASTALPRHALRLVADANILSLACAWAALAILPLPATSPLPLPADRFSIVAIVSASLLFDLATARDEHRDELWPSLAIALALMSPVASQRGLAPGDYDQGITGYVAGAAVLMGLAGLFGGNHGWSGAARWLAWWGAAFALGALPGGALGLVTLPAALALGSGARRLGWGRYATLLAYVLALGALATSLPQPPG